MARPSLILTVELRDFTAKLVVPFDLTLEEASRIENHIGCHILSADLDFPACDPATSLEIVE